MTKSESLPVKTINSYQYIDYNKQIIPIKNDMRTTYDFGHRHQILNDRIGPPNVSAPDVCRVLTTKSMPGDYATETRRQFYAKAPSTFDQKADRAIAALRPQFARSAEERIFRRPPKSIDWAKSLYQRDYVMPPAAERSADAPIIGVGAIEYRSPPRSQEIIYAHQPGHYKYLDPYATSNMLGHPEHSIDQQNGIGRKDYVTLWDWFEYPKSSEKGYGLQFYPVKQRGPKQAVPQDQVRFKLSVNDRLLPRRKMVVPHNGLRTEQQAEFGVPIELSYDSDVYAIKPVPLPFNPVDTRRAESTMYGGGRRIDALINQAGPHSHRGGHGL